MEKSGVSTPLNHDVHVEPKRGEGSESLPSISLYRNEYIDVPIRILC
jgi:hypothetical protein